MTGVTEDELMRGHERQVRLDDLTEIDRRRLMHERIRQAETRAELAAQLADHIVHLDGCIATLLYSPHLARAGSPRRNQIEDLRRAALAARAELAAA